MSTPTTPINRALVWSKRDLRVHDHAPLVAALTHTDALALFVIEPEWLQSPECDSSHVHWRRTGLFLTRQFLDYDPGIHWSRIQMQSGTTGINTLRMYSPTKQAQDQDPQGVFIRRWAPELAPVPLPYLTEPWKMAETVQRIAHCTIDADYPPPIVNDKVAMKAAKDRMYGLRKTQEAREEAGGVQAKHGLRKSGLPPSSQRAKAVSKKKDQTHAPTGYRPVTSRRLFS